MQANDSLVGKARTRAQRAQKLYDAQLENAEFGQLDAAKRRQLSAIIALAHFLDTQYVFFFLKKKKD